MQLTYVTLFEGLIASYFEDSILKRAIAKNLLEVDFLSPRDFTTNKHAKVDDYQVSGGAGLVFFPQPLFSLLQTLKKIQIYDVLVEAGATLSTAFLQAKLVDELISYVAPTFLGAKARTMFNAEFDRMAEQLRFKLLDVTQLGDGIRLKLIPVVNMAMISEFSFKTFHVVEFLQMNIYFINLCRI